MKAFLLVVVVGLCLLSCKKGDLVSPGLFGKWELRRLYGGIYWRDTAYISGNGTVYQFNSDSTFKYFVKGKLTESGNYHIRKNAITMGGTEHFDAILLNNDTYGQIIEVKGTKLTLGTTVTDGIALDFEKIEN